MTRLFCIREEGGKPVAAKLAGRSYANLWSITAAQTKLTDSGKWTRVVQLRADRALLIQAARWAGDLLAVNPRYVLDPVSLVVYVRGPNWNDPDAGYAHYEASAGLYGDELRTEFASYRGVSVDEAERRFRLLMAEIGIYEEEMR